MDNTNAGGVGILGVLLIIFIVLKLVGVINWSWLLVLVPLWIELGAAAVMLIMFAIVELSKRK